MLALFLSPFDYLEEIFHFEMIVDSQFQERMQVPVYVAQFPTVVIS